MILRMINVLKKHFAKIIKIMQIIKLCQGVCHFEWREEVDVKSNKKREDCEGYSRNVMSLPLKLNYLIIYVSFSRV